MKAKLEQLYADISSIDRKFWDFTKVVSDERRAATLADPRLECDLVEKRVKLTSELVSQIGNLRAKISKLGELKELTGE